MFKYADANFSNSRKHAPQHIFQQEGGRQGQTEGRCQLEALEDHHTFHSGAP